MVRPILSMTSAGEMTLLLDTVTLKALESRGLKRVYATLNNAFSPVVRGWAFDKAMETALMFSKLNLVEIEPLTIVKLPYNVRFEVGEYMLDVIIFGTFNRPFIKSPVLFATRHVPLLLDATRYGVSVVVLTFGKWRLDVVVELLIMLELTMRLVPILAFVLKLVVVLNSMEVVENEAMVACLLIIRKDAPFMPNIKFWLSGSNTMFNCCN